MVYLKVATKHDKKENVMEEKTKKVSFRFSCDADCSVTHLVFNTEALALVLKNITSPWISMGDEAQYAEIASAISAYCGVEQAPYQEVQTSLWRSIFSFRNRLHQEGEKPGVASIGQSREREEEGAYDTLEIRLAAFGGRSVTIAVDRQRRAYDSPGIGVVINFGSEGSEISAHEVLKEMILLEDKKIIWHVDVR